MLRPDLTRRFNVRIPLRDGVTLAADLVLPGELPAPVVVMRTPYGRGGAMPTRRADAFAGAGYCACWVDVRGRGDSGGVFEPYRNDGQDGVDVIAWAAAQDWCDGSVASYGGSYPGRIQWLTALHRPVELKAMIVLVTPSDPFVENPTGVPGPMHVHWFRMTDGHAMQYTEAVDWMQVYRHRPLIELDQAAGFRSEGWREQCRHQILDAWWDPVRYQHRIEEVDVPVLHISGWYDDEEIGTPANFARLQAAGRAGQRLLMGPWGHRVNAGRTLGELDFGPDAVIDLEAAMTSFLDEMVRGREPADPPPPARIFLMAANRWLDLEGWPPPGSAERTWHLQSDGRANSRFGDGRLCEDAAAADSPADGWLHDSERPVPFITDASSAQIGGPDDYSGVQTRGDVLVYTSEPLTEPLDVVGPVRLVAFVSTSAADTDVTAKLIDLHPGGFAQRLCDGLVRLRYRAGHDRAQPVQPDTVYEVEIAMWDTAQRFLPGHCIRLEVAASAHPKYAANLGTGGDESEATEGVVAHNRLYHDAARPSRLLVTVLEPAAAGSHAVLSVVAGVDEALAFLCDAYRTRLRRAGRTVEHPVEVARVLAEDRQPPPVVLAGILHDVLEDTDTTREELEARFGHDVARLVAALTQDTSLSGYRERKAALRGQIVGAGADAATVSLADKVAKLRSAESRPAKRKLHHYRETLRGIEQRHGRSRMSVELREQLDRLTAG